MYKNGNTISEANENIRIAVPTELIHTKAIHDMLTKGYTLMLEQKENEVSATSNQNGQIVRIEATLTSYVQKLRIPPLGSLCNFSLFELPTYL